MSAILDIDVDAWVPSGQSMLPDVLSQANLDSIAGLILEALTDAGLEGDVTVTQKTSAFRGNYGGDEEDDPD